MFRTPDSSERISERGPISTVEVDHEQKDVGPCGSGTVVHDSDGDTYPDPGPSADPDPDPVEN